MREDFGKNWRVSQGWKMKGREKEKWKNRMEREKKKNKHELETGAKKKTGKTVNQKQGRMQEIEQSRKKLKNSKSSAKQSIQK